MARSSSDCVLSMVDEALALVRKGASRPPHSFLFLRGIECLGRAPGNRLYPSSLSMTSSSSVPQSPHLR